MRTGGLGAPGAWTLLRLRAQHRARSLLVIVPVGNGSPADRPPRRLVRTGTCLLGNLHLGPDPAQGASSAPHHLAWTGTTDRNTGRARRCNSSTPIRTRCGLPRRRSRGVPADYSRGREYLAAHGNRRTIDSVGTALAALKVAGATTAALRTARAQVQRRLLQQTTVHEPPFAEARLTGVVFQNG